MLRAIIARLFNRGPVWQTAAQPPGKVFPFPKGMKIEALEEVLLAFPTAILDPDEAMASVIFCDDDAKFCMPDGDDKFYLRLQPGMVLSLSKSCEGIVVADDPRPRRFKVLLPPAQGPGPANTP